MFERKIIGLFLLAAAAAVHSGEAWSSANPERGAKYGFAKAIWHESFSAGEKPFTLECHDGAEGKAEIISNGARTGSFALHTVKSNDRGYMIVRFKTRIEVGKGRKIQFNAFYRGLSNVPEYSRGMLRLSVPGEKDFRLYSFIPGINGGKRMQEILCTPDQTWERKFTQRQAQDGMTCFEPVLILAGAASEAVWDDFYAEDDNISAANWTNTLNRRQPADRSPEMIPAEELAGKLLRDIDHTGRVVRIGGRSRLLIDGRITAPIINAPYSKLVKGKNYSNARSFQAAGINLVRAAVRLGEGFPKSVYPGCWTGKDRLDVQAAAEAVRSALRLNPDGLIILSLQLQPYWKFTQDYPDETWLTERGFPAYGGGIHLAESQNGRKNSRNHYPWPSYHSEKLIGLYKQQIAAIVAELKRTGLSKRVVGLHFGGGHDGQMAAPHFDCSRPAVRAFRKYLKARYGRVEALRSAWKDPDATFETASAPRISGRADFLDPETERRQLDFYRFSKCAGWRIAGEIAEYARHLFGKDVFTIRWCMAPYSGSMGGTLDIEDFLYEQKFDALCAQAPYGARPPGSSCMPRVPLDSFHRHGKLYINEFDLRTWLAAPGWEKEIMSITWGLILDLPMWRSVNRKLAGSMFANDMGFWYLDMAPGWFEHPEIMDDIRQTASAGLEQAVRPPSGWQPEAALVADDDGMFLPNVPSPQWRMDVTSLLSDQIPLLGAASVPYAFYSLRDWLEQPELARKFKVIVFAGMFRIDEARLKLLNTLKKNKRTLIFLSGSGFLAGAKDGFGIQVKAAPRTVNHWIVPEPGIRINLQSNWMIRKTSAINAKPAWYDWISIYFAEEKADDRVLARFAHNRKPAVVERTFPDWKAVYIGEPSGLTAEYFNHLAKEAGAYRLAGPGFQCETNGNFMSVHCLRGGKTAFAFPYRADVKNLCSGKMFRNVASIQVNAQAGSTYWFSLSPVR